MNSTEICFAGKLPCGCYVAAAIVDMTKPGCVRDWAKTQRDWERRGISAEITTVEFVRANLQRCVHKEKKKRTNNQGSLSL